MAADPASSADLPFEPASIIRLIRGFVAYGKQSDPDLPDPEAAGMLLWDLSVDTDSAPGLLQLQLLPALSAQLTAVLSEQARDQGAPARTSPSTAALAHHAAHHADPSWGDGSPPAAGAASPSHAASPAHAGRSLQDNSSRPCVAPARMAEICCGILANLYSAPAVIPQLVAQTELTAAVAALFVSLTDPPALAELCRLLTAALSTPQGCSTWLPVLLQPDSISWLLHIVSNTLHPLLLERSLQLIAALLAAGNAAAEEHAAVAAAQTGSPTAPETAAAATPPAAEATAAGGRDVHLSAQEARLPGEPPAQAEQQQQQQQQQQPEEDQQRGSAADAVVLLLQQGLPATLEAILSPAAAPGAQLQQQLLQQLTSSPVQANSEAALTAAAEEATAGGGGWSDDEDVAAPAAVGAAAAVDQRSRQVYSQPQVLMAVLSCLEQCGQQQWVMEEVQQHLRALPQLLLQLLLHCHRQAQQDVLEVLLPVLVTFRAAILPLLRPPGAEVRQQQTGAEQLNSKGNTAEAQQLQESVQCLELWVCVAAVLNDCGPDSLDAMDAAWYLLAAAVVSARDVLGQVLQLQKTTGWAQARLQQLCRCVSESTVPETSQRYKMQCLSSLTGAMQQTVGTAANAAELLGTLRACKSQLE